MAVDVAEVEVVAEEVGVVLVVSEVVCVVLVSVVDIVDVTVVDVSVVERVDVKVVVVVAVVESVVDCDEVGVVTKQPSKTFERKASITVFNVFTVALQPPLT